MKRGLKDIVAMDVAESRKRYNRFPDEKGTERGIQVAETRHLQFVTTVSPMKRGLKADTKPVSEAVADVTTVSPMKRGLKEYGAILGGRVWDRYNRFPDEKGTESRHSMPLQSGAHRGYNRFPDEKGTESCTRARDGRAVV